MDEAKSAAPVVSVIMPVYNAGAYLRAAVDSILAQTFRDFELILVDDGATDGSGDVCDEYARTDARVCVRHGRNGGISASRNVGVAMARGGWLAFCDHDDFCEEDWLGAMLAAADADLRVVKCGFSEYHRRADGPVRLMEVYAVRPDCFWDTGQFRGEAGYQLYFDLSRTLWNGIYRRDFWLERGFRFDESFKSGGEDCSLAIDILAAAGRGACVGRSLYRHYTNEGVSTSSAYHPELLGQYLAIAERELEVFGFDTFPERYMSFKRWNWGAYRNVMRKDGCDLSLAEKAGWLQRYYDRLVGRGAKPVFTGRYLFRRIGVWLLRHGMSHVYLFLCGAMMWKDACLRRLIGGGKNA